MPVATHSATIGDAEVSLRVVSVDGAPWLHARDVASALGFSRSHAAQFVREHGGAEHTRPLRELDPDSRGVDTYIDEDAFLFLLATRCGKRANGFADELLDWYTRVVFPMREPAPQSDPAEPSDEPAEPSEEPAPQSEPAEPSDDPAEPSDEPAEPSDETTAIQPQTADVGPEPPEKRLRLLKLCKEAADAYDLPVDLRMRGEVQQLLADAMLPDGERDSDYTDATTILREKGHTAEQIKHLESMLGQDLALAAGRAPHQAARRYGGNHDKNVNRYHRVRDALLIETVWASFVQRDVYIMWTRGTTRLIPEITQLLAEKGRGRKRPAARAGRA